MELKDNISYFITTEDVIKIILDGIERITTPGSYTVVTSGIILDGIESISVDSQFATFVRRRIILDGIESERGEYVDTETGEVIDNP